MPCNPSPTCDISDTFVHPQHGSARCASFVKAFEGLQPLVSATPTFDGRSPSFAIGPLCLPLVLNDTLPLDHFAIICYFNTMSSGFSSSTSSGDSSSITDDNNTATTPCLVSLGSYSPREIVTDKGLSGASPFYDVPRCLLTYSKDTESCLVYNAVDELQQIEAYWDTGCANFNFHVPGNTILLRNDRKTSFLRGDWTLIPESGVMLNILEWFDANGPATSDGRLLWSEFLKAFPDDRKWTYTFLSFKIQEAYAKLQSAEGGDEEFDNLDAYHPHYCIGFPTVSCHVHPFFAICDAFWKLSSNEWPSPMSEHVREALDAVMLMQAYWPWLQHPATTRVPNWLQRVAASNHSPVPDNYDFLTHGYRSEPVGLGSEDASSFTPRDFLDDVAEVVDSTLRDTAALDMPFLAS